MEIRLSDKQLRVFDILLAIGPTETIELKMIDFELLFPACLEIYFLAKTTIRIPICYWADQLFLAFASLLLLASLL